MARNLFRNSAILPIAAQETLSRLIRQHNRAVMLGAVPQIALLLVIAAWFGKHAPKHASFFQTLPFFAPFLAVVLGAGLVLYGVSLWDRFMARRLGFTCPSCAASLYKPSSQYDRTARIQDNGRCPHCDAVVFPAQGA